MLKQTIILAIIACACVTVTPAVISREKYECPGTSTKHWPKHLKDFFDKLNNFVLVLANGIHVEVYNRLSNEFTTQESQQFEAARQSSEDLQVVEINLNKFFHSLPLEKQEIALAEYKKILESGINVWLKTGDEKELSNAVKKYETGDFSLDDLKYVAKWYLHNYPELIEGLEIKKTIERNMKFFSKELKGVKSLTALDKLVHFFIALRRTC